MRNLFTIQRFRVAPRAEIALFGMSGQSDRGAFVIPSQIDRAPLVVVASSDGGWDHVSVSRRGRCPNWPEMCQIKSLLFDDSEAVMQLHPRASEHVNMHPYCLHLWRPLDVEIPMPPAIMVGAGNRPAKDYADAVDMANTALAELR